MVALPSPPSTTVDAIYAAYEAEAGNGFRDHLGGSLIGKPCERALWYDFRWITRRRFPGRVLRLFETGQREEERIIRNLRHTGATVLDVDPETGRQWQVEAHDGHFGGSLDGMAIDLLEAPKTWHVLEFKTHSVKSFAELKSKGVQLSKPQHYAQMQIYMHLTGLTRAMYVAVCKDTDELYIERVKEDQEEGIKLLIKAERVIAAQHPLPRFSEDPSWYQCRFCDHHGVCHEGAAAEITCRSCLHSTPVKGGWHCARFDYALSPADQRQACERHLFIPDLVPGTVLNAGDDWVEYRLTDGSTWVNGSREAVS